MDLVNKLVYSSDTFTLSVSVFVKKSPSFQNADIIPELDRCTPCVFIGTVAHFSRNKSLLISFGAPVLIDAVITTSKCLELPIMNKILTTSYTSIGGIVKS